MSKVMPLPTSATVAFDSPDGRVGHADQTWEVLAALADGDNCPGAHRRQLFLVEDFILKFNVTGCFAGDFGERLGIDRVAWFEDHVAGEIDTGCHRLADAHTFAGFRRLFPHKDQSFDVAFVISGAVGLEAIETQEKAFSRGSVERGLSVTFRHDAGDGLALGALCGHRCRTKCLSHVVIARTLSGQAGGDDALGFQLARRWESKGRTGLAAEIGVR